MRVRRLVCGVVVFLPLLVATVCALFGFEIVRRGYHPDELGNSFTLFSVPISLSVTCGTFYLLGFRPLSVKTFQWLFFCGLAYLGLGICGCYIEIQTLRHLRWSDVPDNAIEWDPLSHVLFLVIDVMLGIAFMAAATVVEHLCASKLRKT